MKTNPKERKTKISRNTTAKKVTPTKKSAAKKSKRMSSVPEKANAAPKCPHCGRAYCQRHCPSAEDGVHVAGFGDVEVVESPPALVVVEIFCDRCWQGATAVVDERIFKWRGAS